MPEDRSLEEFAGGDDDSTAADATAPDGASAERTSDGAEPTGDSPADSPPESESSPDPEVDSPPEADSHPVAGDDATTDEVEPMRPTYTFSSADAPCADCGETVRRRWYDDVGYVCSDCKEW